MLSLACLSIGAKDRLIDTRFLEQFQQKWEPVLRPKLR